MLLPNSGNRKAIWPIKTRVILSDKVLFQNKGRKNTYWTSWKTASKTKIVVDRSLIQFHTWWLGVLTSHLGWYFCHISRTANTDCLVLHLVHNLQRISVCLHCTSFVLFSLLKWYCGYFQPYFTCTGLSAFNVIHVLSKTVGVLSINFFDLP